MGKPPTRLSSSSASTAGLWPRAVSRDAHEVWLGCEPHSFSWTLLLPGARLTAASSACVAIQLPGLLLERLLFLLWLLTLVLMQCSAWSLILTAWLSTTSLIALLVAASWR
jgi:hypothetical protein